MTRGSSATLLVVAARLTPVLDGGRLSLTRPACARGLDVRSARRQRRRTVHSAWYRSILSSPSGACSGPEPGHDRCALAGSAVRNGRLGPSRCDVPALREVPGGDVPGSSRWSCWNRATGRRPELTPAPFPSRRQPWRRWPRRGFEDRQIHGRQPPPTQPADPLRPARKPHRQMWRRAGHEFGRSAGPLPDNPLRAQHHHGATAPVTTQMRPPRRRPARPHAPPPAWPVRQQEHPPSGRAPDP